jgi:hypothetical protein
VRDEAILHVLPPGAASSVRHGYAPLLPRPTTTAAVTHSARSEGGMGRGNAEGG